MWTKIRFCGHQIGYFWALYSSYKDVQIDEVMTGSIGSYLHKYEEELGDLFAPQAD